MPVDIDNIEKGCNIVYNILISTGIWIGNTEVIQYPSIYKKKKKNPPHTPKVWFTVI